MSANVRFSSLPLRTNFFLFIFLITFSMNLNANEKKQIVTNLENLNSLEFTFNQLINDKKEKGTHTTIPR